MSKDFFGILLISIFQIDHTRPRNGIYDKRTSTPDYYVEQRVFHISNVCAMLCTLNLYKSSSLVAIMKQKFTDGVFTGWEPVGHDIEDIDNAYSYLQQTTDAFIGYCFSAGPWSILISITILQLL